MSNIRYYRVRLASETQACEIRQWADVNNVDFWWVSNGIDNYTFAVDECTIALIKLKFGGINVIR
jgi:hypothetical protein